MFDLSVKFLYLSVKSAMYGLNLSACSCLSLLLLFSHLSVCSFSNLRLLVFHLSVKSVIQSKSTCWQLFTFLSSLSFCEICVTWSKSFLNICSFNWIVVIHAAFQIYVEF